jgi:hypothetical protein
VVAHGDGVFSGTGTIEYLVVVGMSQRMQTDKRAVDGKQIKRYSLVFGGI